ncbi:uncharacterized protein LOC108327370 [Vigna angularis]|uniref:uncharacterized protein LOC108327370 n=1 Tax=Phaseolus angularis TaxID=3914 RepID=UPI000809B679|nr:uncharacterized protein LOC108327370 [Vigna angularis]
MRQPLPKEIYYQQLHARFRAKPGYEEERGTTFSVQSFYITVVAGFDEIPQRGLISLLRGGPPRGFVLSDDVFGYEVCRNPRRLVAVFPLDEVLHSGDSVKVSTADNAFDFTIGLVFSVFGSCLLLVLECGGDNMQGKVLPLECVFTFDLFFFFVLQKGFSFAHCTTCKASYHLFVHVAADRKWRTLKFRFFVTRDILFIFLFVQLVIA